MPTNNYQNYSKEQLLTLIQTADAKKHYGLVWEEDKVPEKVVQDCLEKTAVLKEVKKKNINADINLPENILIEGDNYHALKVLAETHKAAFVKRNSHIGGFQGIKCSQGNPEPAASLGGGQGFSLFHW